MGLLLCVIRGGENGTNSDLAVFSENVAFSATLWLPACPPPPPSHLIGVLLVLATSVKNYLKWQKTQLAIQCTVGTVNYFE